MTAGNGPSLKFSDIRKHAGRTREEERFGAKMLRVDIPIDGDPEKGWETRWYGGAAIFSMSLTTETVVMKLNKPYESAYRLRAPIGDSFPADGPELDLDEQA